MEEHHGGEIGEDLAHGKGRDGIEGGDDTERGEDLERVVVFVDEWEIGAFSA